MPEYIAQYFNWVYYLDSKKLDKLTNEEPREYRFKANNDKEAIKRGNDYLSYLAEHYGAKGFPNGGFSLDNLLRLENVEVNKKT